MIKARNKKAIKLSVALLTLIMAVAFMSVSSFAANKPAENARVSLTVSDQGTIAKAKNGDLMAWKGAWVKDLNGDGRLTADEAMVAQHEMWCSAGADGFAMDENGVVTKFWGNTTGPFEFFLNDAKLTEPLSSVEVGWGSLLEGAILKDKTGASDWFATFGKSDEQVVLGGNLEVELKGYAANLIGSEMQPLSDIQLGKINLDTGAFEPMTGVVTDANGKATISVTEPGFFLLSGQGVAAGGSPLMAPVLCVTVGKENDMSAKAKTVTVKYSKLKKKAQTISGKKAFTVKNAKGKVFYFKADGNKKIKIDEETGKVTVPKGLKKGTYKVGVNVFDDGNEEYFEKEVFTTLKIKVK